MIAFEHGEAIQGYGQILEPYCGECHQFLSIEQVRDFCIDAGDPVDVSDLRGVGTPGLWLLHGDSSVCECRARSIFVHAYEPGQTLADAIDVLELEGV